MPDKHPANKRGEICSTTILIHEKIIIPWPAARSKPLPMETPGTN
jgi:hypothetical protein